MLKLVFCRSCFAAMAASNSEIWRESTHSNERSRELQAAEVLKWKRTAGEERQARTRSEASVEAAVKRAESSLSTDETDLRKRGSSRMHGSAQKSTWPPQRNKTEIQKRESRSGTTGYGFRNSLDIDLVTVGQSEVGHDLLLGLVQLERLNVRLTVFRRLRTQEHSKSVSNRVRQDQSE